MRVLLINTSERMGGAAISCRRLMEALRGSGVEAKMLVRDRQTQDPSVVALPHSWKLLWKFLWERVVIWQANRFRRHNLFSVDVANTGTDVTTLPDFQDADVIHLHWINQGMLSLKNIGQILRSGKPVVWTMHDMWPCTGICHHANRCDKYTTRCGRCPYLLGGGSPDDLSRRTFDRKRELFAKHRIHFVTCSQWLERQARKSALLVGQEIEQIPNPINVSRYKPMDKREARQRLSLPPDMRLMLFGSVKITHKQKGIDYLIDACRLLAGRHPDMRETLGVVVVGGGSQALENRLPFRVFPQEYIGNDHGMVDVYNACDVYVIPSLAENLPNTIMEAMACGIPCVGFQVGGIPEMIDHLHNGYVAGYESASDLARGIHTVLTDPDYRQLSSEAVRKVATHYSERIIAQRYIQLYNQAVAAHE